MPRFQLKESNRHLTSTAGLALIGHCLAFAQLERLDVRLPKRGKIRMSDVVKSYPSGKPALSAAEGSDCNDVSLHLGMFAYNCLRLIGHPGLTGELAPVRHPAKRRRIKTVLQELRYCAAQFIRKARQRILDFGRSCPVVAVFRAVQEDLLTAGRSP